MELCEGKNLLELISQNRPSEPYMHLIVYKLMRAVQRLHAANIVHNDIKDTNVMVDMQDEYCSVKLIDLGMAKYVEEPE